VSRLRGVTSDREENVLKYHGSSNCIRNGIYFFK
jgi:hypothetical protein